MMVLAWMHARALSRAEKEGGGEVGEVGSNGREVWGSARVRAVLKC